MAIGDIIIVTLAVYRLAADLALGDGPANVFGRLRGAVTERYGADHWLTRGVHCPICLSLWIALILVAVAPLLPSAVFAWLAVAGAVRALVIWLEARP